MRRTVILHGWLAKKYGTRHEGYGKNIQLVLKSVNVSIPGVSDDIRKHNWEVIKGDVSGGDNLTVEAVGMALGSQEEIHIVPSFEGAGRTGQIIAGVVLVVVGAVLTIYGFGAVGVPLMVSGAGMLIGALLTPPIVDDIDEQERNQRPSFMFNGAVNTSSQGVAVPLVFGKFRSGSVIISAGIDTETFAI